MISPLARLVLATTFLAVASPSTAQREPGGPVTLTRPDADACPLVAREAIIQATAGLAALPADRAKERYNSAQVRLRQDDRIKTMLRCLMSRTH